MKGPQRPWEDRRARGEYDSRSWLGEEAGSGGFEAGLRDGNRVAHGGAGGVGRLWTRDEVLLALDLFVNRPQGYKTPPQAEIDRLAVLLGRSSGSVGRKVANIQSVDPEYVGSALPNTGSLEEPLFREWRGRPTELHAEAERIRGLFGDPSSEFEPELEPSLRPAVSSASDAAAIDALVEKAKEFDGLAGVEKREVEVRRGQRAFAVAVLALYSDSPNGKARRCPGCLHGRVKANGRALLEAHHVVGFPLTRSMDPRWGVPLCPNCHTIVEVGGVDAKAAVYGSVREVYPAFVVRLRELVQEGRVTAAMLAVLVADRVVVLD